MAEIYQLVVGVRFSPVNRIYHFDAAGMEISLNDQVIVETSKGKQIGTVAQIMRDFEVEGEPLKMVDRLATPGELVSRELWATKNDEIREYCQKRVIELNFRDVKIHEVEYNYDGTRLMLTFSTANEEKTDLKSLKNDILKRYGNVQNVDIRQLGPRDVAKKICGLGACGMPNRCCSSYLTEFSSISIKMAKEQGISLTPAEITGMCGRLRCCLVFENDYYVECRKNLPKKNKKVMTPQGEGKVIEVFPLRGVVLVDIPEVGRREYKADQITVEAANPVQPPIDNEKKGPENSAKKERLK